MIYRKIMSNLIEDHLFEPWDKITRKTIEKRFREKCPGPYKLRWHRKLDENFMPTYSLIFNSTEESTIWFLKWS